MAAGYPTLEQIRLKYENVAKYYITVGTTRAFKTGALRNSIKVVKTKDKNGNQQFDLKSLYYGVFMNFGFTHRGGKKVRPRPFATTAANADSLKTMINDYQKGEIDIFILDEMKDILKQDYGYSYKK